MRKIAIHFALLALAGTMAAPAFAAPPAGPAGSSDRSAVDCNDPAMAKSPACLRKGKPGMRGQEMRGQGMQPMSPRTGNPPTPMQHNAPMSTENGASPMQRNAPPSSSKQVAPNRMAPSQMERAHKGPPAGFQAFRRSFHFPHFAPPPFRAREGFVVPRSYHRWLRPLPRAFFGFYPMYRGYLFFVTPSGDIVIVSPRTFRIVAIL
jgi:hypothetical protein